jgi:hypothetical protein
MVTFNPNTPGAGGITSASGVTDPAATGPGLSTLFSTSTQTSNTNSIPAPTVSTVAPFTLTDSQTSLNATPSQLAASVTPVTGGLGALLNSLDTSGTSDQVNQLIQDAQSAASSGDGLTAQKDLAQAQLLFETMSTILNVITQMQMEAIRNSKVQ